MKYVLSAEQMRTCDSYTSEHFGIDAAVLMERAAVSAFISICNCGKMFEDSRTLIVCGTGNNGADGLALARIMYEGGYAADYCIPFDDGRHSMLFDRQKATLEKYGLMPVPEECPKGDYDIIVDAMFGIGLSRPLSEDRCVYLKKLNEMKGFKVALDIPSGINADSGEVMGEAFRADITVTFGFAKVGLLVYPGKNYAGRILVANIGITDKSLEALGERTRISTYMEEGDLIGSLPVRPDDGNKGTFGKVLIYAGSEDICGACMLSAMSAFKSGAGMVKVITCKENASVIKQALPEAMITLKDRTGQIREDIRWADVILAGPGIGTGEESVETLRFLLENGKDLPFVIDADGLNIISDDPNGLKDLIRNREAFTVFTPHIGELSRLTGVNASELKKNIAGYTDGFAKELGICMVSKEAVTCVGDGTRTVYIASGNNGMATAGSGDVLAGITAALLGTVAAGSGGDFFTAVLNAVYLHGMSGSACLESMSEDSVTAGDIIISLQRVMKMVRDGQAEMNNWV